MTGRADVNTSLCTSMWQARLPQVTGCLVLCWWANFSKIHVDGSDAIVLMLISAGLNDSCADPDIAHSQLVG